MSECVVRMEKPKSCDDCDIAQRFGNEIYCPFFGWYADYDNCPVFLQLPKGHGRLVDADELYMKIKGHDTTRPLLERRKGVIEEKHICLHDICKQPTIVPAERSET